MKYTKPHLTFEQQIDLLISRGLIVHDKTSAAQTLSQINYYRLSAYCLPFQKPKDCFIKGTTFDDIIRIYQFDHDMRVLLFNVLDYIEVAIRTSVTYHHTKIYGPFGYIDQRNFSPKFKHANWIYDLEREVKRSKEIFVKYYRAKYSKSSHLPLWIATEIISFGALSIFFQWMKNNDKKIISQEYGVHTPVFQSWLHSLVYLRNLCAHHSRIWNRQLAIQPKIPNKDTSWITPFLPNNNRLFSLILIIHSLCKNLRNQFKFKNTLEKLIMKYPDINYKSMGFQDGWEKHKIFR